MIVIGSRGNEIWNCSKEIKRQIGVVRCGNKADAIRCCINAAIQAGEVSAWEAGSFDG